MPSYSVVLSQVKLPASLVIGPTTLTVFNNQLYKCVAPVRYLVASSMLLTTTFYFSWSSSHTQLNHLLILISPAQRPMQSRVFFTPSSLYISCTVFVCEVMMSHVLFPKRKVMLESGQVN